MCWAAILAIPAGMTQITMGPCLSGPETTAGSLFVLILGLLSTVGAAIGIVAVIRGIGAVSRAQRIGAGFSICGACIAVLPGLILLVTGYFSTLYRLGNIR